MADISRRGFLISLAAATLPKVLADTGQRVVDWQVYALQYGFTPSVKKRYFVSSAKDSEKIPLAWVFWLIKSKDELVLVDTGFDDDSPLKAWGFAWHINPAELLSDLGIDVRDIQKVILTHSHWDHMACVGLYKNARIYIQQAELRWAKKRWEKPGKIDLKISQQWRIIETEKRDVVIEADEYEIAPGISVQKTGFHTPGCQIVHVQAAGAPLTLVSDEAPTYENITKCVPGQVRDSRREAAVRLIKQIRQKHANIGRILPGHEPRIFTNPSDYGFKKVTDNIVKVP